MATFWLLRVTETSGPQAMVLCNGRCMVAALLLLLLGIVPSLSRGLELHNQPVPASAVVQQPPDVTLGVQWSPETQHWRRIKPSNLQQLGAINNTIILFDKGPCWWLADALYSNTSTDLSKRSGGEYLWCSRLVVLLQSMGYTLAAVPSNEAAEAVVLTGREKGVHHLMFVHWGWDELLGQEEYKGGKLIRPPFRQNCFIAMDFWGASGPKHLWPGDLRFYLTMYPHPQNTYIGVPEAPGCPLIPAGSNMTQRLFKDTYGVVYGKFDHGTANPKRIHQAFRSATLWANLRKQAQIVFVACSDDLAAALGLGMDYVKDFICWNKLQQHGSYEQLLMHAAFVIGLGIPPDSPTPVVSLQCRTPVIMPIEQHRPLAANAWPRQFHAVHRTEDVLAGVSACLRDCKPSFQPTARGEVEKVDDVCFKQPPTMAALISREVVAPHLRNMLVERQRQCNTWV